MNVITVRRLAKQLLPPRVYRAIKAYLVIPGRRIAVGARQMVGSCMFRLPFDSARRRLYPSLISIFLTTRCNLRCFICRREGFKGEDLRFENLYKLEEAIRYARVIDLTGWGEPLLYPRFEDVLRYIYSLNGRQDLIQITSNGTRLSEQIAGLLSGHLKLLTVSLNAATAETYNRDMKHGDFKDTLSHIRTFLSGLKVADRRKIRLHFVAHTENFREVPAFVILANDLGIPAVSIGQYLASNAEHSQYTLLQVKDEYNALIDRAEDLGKELGVQVSARRFFTEHVPSLQECLSPFEECYIQVNGDVSPCCYCGSYRMGNVYETSFEEVWFGEAYRRLRERRYLEACQKCAPFIPLDDCEAHFTAYFKETESYREIGRELG